MSALRKRVLTTKQDVGDSSLVQGSEDYAFIRSGYSEPKPLSGSEIMAKTVKKEAGAEQGQPAPSTPTTKNSDAQAAEPQQSTKEKGKEMTVKDLQTPAPQQNADAAEPSNKKQSENASK